MQYLFIDKNSLLRVKYKTNSNFRMESSHFHNNIYELFVMVEGTRKLITKDCLFELKPKSTFLIKPGASHRFLDSEFSRFSSLYMEIPKQWLNTYLADCPSKDTDVYLITPNNDDWERILEIISDFVKCFKLKKDGYEYEIYAHALKVISIMFGYDNEAPQKVQQSRNYDRVHNIIEYINENYARDLKLSGIADKFYISEHYLCHLFKDCTGKSIGSYITEVRIANAIRMLEQTSYDVKTIGKKCGYKSLSHFSHTFKSYANTTPLKYRKQKQFV